MIARRSLHFMAVACVVLLLLVAFINSTMQEGSQWQVASEQGLHNKVQTELAQIYWQWQQQGRPEHIIYSPEQAKNMFYQPQGEAIEYRIQMSSLGVPIIASTIDGCKEFMTWFVEQNVLQNQIKVSIQRLLITPSETERTAKQDKIQTMCQFKFFNTVYQYNVKSGEFGTTKLE